MEDESAAGLRSPLLSTASSTNATIIDNFRSQIGSMALDWPADEAERIKLFVPQDYDPYQDQRNPGKCFFRLDEDRNLLTVISDSTGEILDIIDPNDVVGVKVDIELSSGEDGGASQATNVNAMEPRSISLRGQQEQEQLLRDRGTMDAAAGGDSIQQRSSYQDNEPASEIPVDTQASAILTLYVYPKRDLSKDSIVTSCFVSKKPKPNREYPPLSTSAPESSPPAGQQSKRYGHRYQHHRRFSVAPVEDFSDLSATVNAIRRAASPKGPCESPPQSNDKRRLLVVVNPFSGQKKADEVYATTVRPMLEEAGIEHDYMITTHAGHARERMKERGPAIGIDDDGEEGSSRAADLAEYSGIVCIGGDGLLYEVMQGIHDRSDKDEILKTIKLGTVGAGTSNGFSASLAHASEEKFSPLDWSFMVAKGNTAWIDLSVYQTTSKSYTSFLTFCWGIIAEIDIESEIIRFMGFLRMDLWGVWRTLFLRKYRAKFSYLPPTNGKTMDKLPPLDEPLPENEGWVIAEDTFILFWASQVSHAGQEMIHSPQSKIDDGVFNIFIVRGQASRLRLALIMIAMASGGHVDMYGVEFVQCSAYRLEPVTPGSFNDLDGEVIESGPVQAAVMPSAIQAYCNL